MRIGILTFHRARNCGAMLQAWALKAVLEKMGHSVEFPFCNSVGAKKIPMICCIPKGKRGMSWIRSFLGRLYLDVRYILHGGYAAKSYDKFRSKFLPERKCEVNDLDRYFDVIVVGSDQVWRSAQTKADTALFRGDIIPLKLPVVSYAASIGDSFLPEEDARNLVKSLIRQKAISVRESLAQEQLSLYGINNVSVVLDPTLLVGKDDFLKVAQAGEDKVTKPYIYMYTLEATDFEMSIAENLSKHLGMNLLVSPVYPDCKCCDSRFFNYHTGPSEMIRFIEGAEFVIAASFHGTAIALTFHKRFISIRNRAGESDSRPMSLLSKLGLESRLIDPTVSFGDIISRLIAPLPETAFEKLSILAEQSKMWLANALKETM